MKAFEENISEHTGLRPQILEEIIYFAQTYKLSKVILFGSRARGDFSPKSDIDLAAAGDEIVNFYLDIVEKTDTLLQLAKKLAVRILKEYIPAFILIKDKIAIQYQDILNG